MTAPTMTAPTMAAPTANMANISEAGDTAVHHGESSPAAGRGARTVVHVALQAAPAHVHGCGQAVVELPTAPPPPPPWKGKPPKRTVQSFDLRVFDRERFGAYAIWLGHHFKIIRVVLYSSRTRPEKREKQIVWDDDQRRVIDSMACRW